MKRSKYLIIGIILLIIVGIGINSLFNTNQSNNDPDESTTIPNENTGGDERPNVETERFGLVSYNTEEVVKELLYIEENVEYSEELQNVRVLITGSTAGIGELTAKYLIERGYSVVVHARNENRAEDVRRDLPDAEAVVIGDLTDLEQTKQLAEDINALGTFDVIIHNAGVYTAPTEDIFNVNILSPYILTSLVNTPKQLIYLSSSANQSGNLKIEEMLNGSTNINYSDSKQQLHTFAMALARKWPDVKVNAINPGWVPTRMGKETGSAPEDLRAGYMTLVWLVEELDEASRVSGQYFFQSQPSTGYAQIVYDEEAQEALINALEVVTGVQFPE